MFTNDTDQKTRLVVEKLFILNKKNYSLELPLKGILKVKIMVTKYIKITSDVITRKPVNEIFGIFQN